MADVRFAAASRIYPGTDVPAVDALDLHIGDGELVVLVGLGSGKTTALRMLARPGGGGRRLDLHRRPRRHRRSAEAPRRGDGLPELRSTRTSRSGEHRVPAPDREGEEVGARAARPGRRGAARTDGDLQRKPGQLSGGQRQRVAMGRAIVQEPSVFLMDEPLSNLDAKLRVQMRADIAALQSRLGVTTVYVTHD